MKHFLPGLALALATPSAVAQEAEALPPTADTVAAKVDGFEITEADVERRFMALIRERTGGQMVPPEKIAQLRDTYHDTILEELVSDRLMDVDVQRAEISLSDEEFVQVLEESLTGQLLRSDMSRADLDARIQEVEGIPLEAFIQRQSSDPGFRQAVLHTRLLVERFPEETAVTTEEIEGRYAADLASVYTFPPKVRASHIIFGTDGLSLEEATAKAQAILTECQNPEADFAGLARAHSTGPSAPQGGDLGFFPRHGVMTEAFAAAAFDLAVGEVSGLVETEFGVHIIKCTSRKEGRVIPLEESRASIREELKFEKVGPLRERHLQTLRASAQIEYLLKKA